MTTLKYEFYESDEYLVVTVFDRGADPTCVSIKFEPRRLSYMNGDNKTLVLEPLKGQINTEASNFTIGRVKVEIRLVKLATGRWNDLIGDEPDLLAKIPQPTPAVAEARKEKKNWEGITTDMLKSEKETTIEEDPNVGGDSTLNSFFQKIFADSDEDTKRAMMKSFQESGGTTLSTNWADVKKGRVPVKPPSGSEEKKWD
ncbi:SGS domain-containing protein [Amanita rubescens]|nr:SGS domain-containing protein [Amanita rubescens]